MKFGHFIYGIFILVLALLSGCVGSVNSLNPIGGDNKHNSVNKSPSVSTINVTYDRVALTGSNLDQISSVRITGGTNNKTMTIKTQSASALEAVATTSPSLTFYAQVTYNLIISSASGETIYPINFLMLDNTVSTSKLQNYSVTSSKLGTQSVTYDKISTTGAADGDVLTYSSADSSWIPAASTGGGGGGGVSSITRGSGLMNAGTSITSTGTISVNVGSGSGQIPTLNGSGDYTSNNSIILNSDTANKGWLSLFDSGDGHGSDFQFYNASGNLHIAYSPDYDHTSYSDAIIIKSHTSGEVDVKGNVIIDGSLTINNGGANAFTLPTTYGTANQVLVSNGLGGTSWTTPGGGGTVTSITASTGLTGGVITGIGTIAVDWGTGPNQIPRLDASGLLTVGVLPPNIPAANIGGGIVSDAEFAYVDGAVGGVNFQTQINGKEPTITAGAAGTYYYSDGALKSWRKIVPSDIDTTASPLQFMTIYNGAPRTLGGGGSITQPVSEVAVANAIAGVAALFEPILTMNTNGGLGIYPALGDVPIGNDGTHFGYQNFMTYLYDKLTPDVGATTILIGNGVSAGATGLYNTGLGQSAMANLAAGGYNTAVGYQSQFTNAGAQNNSSLGYQAQYTLTTGATNNSALGFQTQYAITTGDDNTAIGYRSQYAVTTGTSNASIGSQSLQSITTGTDNTAIGAGAMNSAGVAVTGNTAIGSTSLQNVTSNNNTAVGYQSLKANAGGVGNVGVGASSGVLVTSGSFNLLMGYGAGPLLTTGSGNTFLGYQAGTNASAASTGGMVIGYQAGPAAAADISGMLYLNSGQSNTPLIGGNFSTGVVFINYDIKTNPTTVPSLGNTGLYVVGDAYKSVGGTTWQTVSDRRLKDRIVPFDRGLEEILGLRPVRFHYKDNPGIGLNSKAENIGVVAQEVQEEIPEAVSKGANGYLGFRLDPVFWASINAIQELNGKIEKLEQENRMLKDYLCAKDPQAPFCAGR